jgi:hypothetical protein
MPTTAHDVGQAADVDAKHHASVGEGVPLLHEVLAIASVQEGAGTRGVYSAHAGSSFRGKP